MYDRFANGEVAELLVAAIGLSGLCEDLVARLLVFVDCLRLLMPLLYCADGPSEFGYCPCCRSCEKLVGYVSRHVDWYCLVVWSMPSAVGFGPCNGLLVLMWCFGRDL